MSFRSPSDAEAGLRRHSAGTGGLVKQFRPDLKPGQQLTSQDATRPAKSGARLASFDNLNRLRRATEVQGEGARQRGAAATARAAGITAWIRLSSEARFRKSRWCSGSSRSWPRRSARPAATPSRCRWISAIAVASLIFIGIFVVAVAAQIAARKFHPFLYWADVVSPPRRPAPPWPTSPTARSASAIPAAPRCCSCC